MNSIKKHWLIRLLSMISLTFLFSTTLLAKDLEILNVSYDPTREFYQEFNNAFKEYWEAEHEQTVNIRMSHGGSGRQALSVMQGLAADIVTLALAYDIDMIAERTSRLETDWQAKLPLASSPYTSTIVFLVRKGNPKNIHDWSDLVRDDIAVISPNPKTSGGARWNYLAAWGFAYIDALQGLDKISSADASEQAQAHAKAQSFVQQLFRNVTVMDTGARASSNSFIERGMGDVLIAWENEALMALNAFESHGFELIVPSVSIQAEPPVAAVTANNERKGNHQVVNEYLNYLYSPVGQAIAAKYYFRPQYQEHADEKDLAAFQAIELFRLDDIFGNWKEVQDTHFSNDGIFDQITRR
ncbi:hypothetical protein DN062_07705 [Nitrincola tibetensis]|uniref:Sulfate ABC transporter substrate-binding protein n=1 Tax=Nitrincola tibetensis TaxID=2219697 RepID=A0A364NNJ4_9GAMM|nr:sulfate ABC transporter substrate-binding protein [Nitrincola tibetensis]RAU18643.1 hypothetical protein DN062_07705 [Nitrincola tibetensis]